MAKILNYFAPTPFALVLIFEGFINVTILPGAWPGNGMLVKATVLKTDSVLKVWLSKINRRMIEVASKFVGSRSGMRRPIEAFRGPELYHLHKQKAILVRLYNIALRLTKRLRYHMFGARKS